MIFKPIIRGSFYLLLIITINIIILLNEFNCLETTQKLNNEVNFKNILKRNSNNELLLNRSSNLDNNANNYETNSIGVSDEEEDEEEYENQNEDYSKKFTWKDHSEDHGIYSQRSLMSTSAIKDLLNSKADIETSGIDEDDLSALNRVDYSEKEWQLMFRSFDMMYESLASSTLYDAGKKTNLFDEILSRLSPNCRRDIKHIVNSVKKHKLWALRMVDSNGKLPSGITYGRFSSPGDYEECLDVNVDEDVYRVDESNSLNKRYYKNSRQKLTKTNLIEHYKFKGKYCLIDFRLPLPEKPKNKLLSIHEPIFNMSKTSLAKEFPEINDYSSYASVFYEVGYLHGFCIPSSCDVNELSKSIGKSLEGLYIIVNNTIDCEVRPDVRPPLRTSQLISFTLLAIIFLNATLASFVYRYKTKHYDDKENIVENNKNQLEEESNELGKNDYRLTIYSKIKHWFERTILANRFYSNCFSIQSNFNRLTKPDPRGLTFVHYTRIVAMAFTVITHTAAMGTLQAITKPADASNSEQIFRDFIPQMLANSFTSIQIFFFMAGFMLVVSTYPSIKREKGYLSFVEYATKRAIRLMPGLAATIAINFLWPLFVDGPMLSYFFRLIVIPCEENWYRTLGFLSNFDNVEKMCIRHSYFSASDYQLHLVAFPLLILLYKQPTISIIIATILTIAGFVAQVIMVLTKTVLPFMMVDYVDKEVFINVIHYIHHPVWNHMSAFFYGFIIGYLVVKQVRINLSEQSIKRIWCIMLPIGIGSIFAPYFWNHYKRPIYKWQMVLYVLFDRFALLTTCAWLSYASMVLAKPIKKEKEDRKENNSNLPEMITIDNKIKKVEDSLTIQNDQIRTRKEQHLPASGSFVRVPSFNIINEQKSNKDLHLINSQLTINNSIPRQRSSPNIRDLSKSAFFEEITQQQNYAQPLKTSYSNVNLSTIQETVNDENKPDETIVNSNKHLNNDTDDKKKEDAKTTQQTKRVPVVSNINTLCLVLSRLTFQLYLFNMVVLWIDVTHSKYFWFFSYYFIITKALAVYICSTVLATVFFVTLESPSLTLYIKWIKCRANARAKKQQFRTDELVKSEQEQANLSKKDFVYNRKSSPESMDRFTRPSSKISGSIQNFDGINMKVCTPIENSSHDKSHITFIDLPPRDGKLIIVTPTDEQQQTVDQEASTTTNNTKM